MGTDGGRSFGWILLNQRESLFDLIADDQKTGELIRYFLQKTIVYSAVYGAALGFFALNWQILLSAVKTPLLLLGALGICLPALFTFNILLGSKLSFRQTTALLLMATYIIAAILISLAPILLFFIFSSEGKAFVVLLNVGFFAVAGAFGVKLLWMGMGYLTRKAGGEPNAAILRLWSLIYMFVGTQLAWMLRPFVGQPEEVVLFRRLGGNFYQALYHIFLSLFD